MGRPKWVGPTLCPVFLSPDDEPPIDRQASGRAVPRCSSSSATRSGSRSDSSLAPTHRRNTPCQRGRHSQMAPRRSPGSKPGGRRERRHRAPRLDRSRSEPRQGKRLHRGSTYFPWGRKICRNCLRTGNTASSSIYRIPNRSRTIWSTDPSFSFVSSFWLQLARRSDGRAQS